MLSTFAPLRTLKTFNTDSSCVVSSWVVAAHTHFMAKGFSCSYLEGQVTTSDALLVLSRHSCILCPDKV